jgi:pilus assembly protein CpaE
VAKIEGSKDMSQLLRVCLFNREVQQSLHQPFQALADLRIVGQVGSVEELLDWLSRLSIDLVVINLDSDEALEAVDRVRQTVPRCGILGISCSSDPNDIIRAMRAGCNQYVRWPVDSKDLHEAIAQIRTQSSPRVSSSKRICVLGASGGAGATTIACNLAIELATLSGADCGLVDLNLELGDVGCLFDAQPAYSIADLCKEHVEIDHSVLEKAFHKMPCNVSVLTRPQRLEDAYEVTPGGVTNMLNQAKAIFPFIVADLPRLFDPTGAAALVDADRVLVVAQLTVTSIRNATRIHEWLQKMGTPEDSIGVVLNRASPGIGHITIDDVAEHFGKPAFAVVPNDYQWVQLSLDMGYAEAREEANNPVQLAIHAIARKIAVNLLEQEPDAHDSAPFLKRFWKGRGGRKPAPVTA